MKRLYVFLLVLILTFVTALSACSSPSASTGKISGSEDISESETFSEEDVSGEESDQDQEIKLVLPANGAKVTSYSSPVKGLLSTTNDQEAAAFWAANSAQDAMNNGVSLKWSQPEKLNYTLYVSESSDFENSLTYEFYGKKVRNIFTVYNLKPGEYFWKVVDENGKTSPVRSFKLNDGFSLRVIDPATVGISNMRDLGGYKTESGKTINYGMVYRSAKLSGMTEETKEYFFNDLGIKTEIDLRIGNTATEIPNLSEGLMRFYNAGIVQCMYIIPSFNQTTPVKRKYDSRTATGLKTAFEVLADKDNYPLIFHCSAGADRTGTFALLLEGLLGVSYNDMAIDYELTGLGGMGLRLRSALSGGKFDDSGVYQDNSNNLIAFGKTYKMLLADYGDESGTFSAAVENYLKTVCKISDETIVKVKENLLH